MSAAGAPLHFGMLGSVSRSSKKFFLKIFKIWTKILAVFVIKLVNIRALYVLFGHEEVFTYVQKLAAKRKRPEKLINDNLDMI